MKQQQVPEPGVIDAVVGTDSSSVPSARELVAAVTSMLAQGSVVGHEAKTLAEELVRIGLGRSQVHRKRGDGRFRDPVWQDNAVFHRPGRDETGQRHPWGKPREGLGQLAFRCPQSQRHAVNGNRSCR